MPANRAAKSARTSLDLAWDEKLPVNPIEISKKLLVSGHKVKFSGNSDVGLSGEAYFDDEKDEFCCIYNNSEVPYRQRFTQAHELGHVVLGHVNEGKKPKRDKDFRVNSDDPDEIAANQYAAELLMPEDYVREAVKHHHYISELAKLFNVSTAAMRYRLKNLGLL